MKRAYLIPLGSRTFAEHADYLSSLPIVWDDPDSKNIVADGYGYVEVMGEIPDHDEVPVKEPPQE